VSESSPGSPKARAARGGLLASRARRLQRGGRKPDRIDELGTADLGPDPILYSGSEIPPEADRLRRPPLFKAAFARRRCLVLAGAAPSARFCAPSPSSRFPPVGRSPTCTTACRWSRKSGTGRFGWGSRRRSHRAAPVILRVWLVARTVNSPANKRGGFAGAGLIDPGRAASFAARNNESTEVRYHAGIAGLVYRL
jgi:hypothetical protein